MQKFVSRPKCIAGLLAAALLASAGQAIASPELTRKYNCVACHAEDKKKYGPTYKEVAIRYAGDDTAVEKLAKKIQQGGAGVWGRTPMPAQPRVTDEDALAIAQWVLSLK